MASQLLARGLRLSQRSRFAWRSAGRCSISSGSSAGAGNSGGYNALVIGGGAFGCAVALWYWKSNKHLDDSIGMRGMHGRTVEYSRLGVVHPEAEAEQMMVDEQTRGSVSQEPSSTTLPSANSGVDEVDSVPDIPGFAPYVLIGAGTASFAAARAIRESDPTAQVLIIGEEQYTPYSRPPLSKQLWLYEDHEATKNLKFKASWSKGKLVDVFYKSKDYCSPKELPTREGGGIAVVTGRKAVSMDPTSKKISLDNGWEVIYEKCLIATGGQPRQLPIFSEGSNNLKNHISAYRTILDYKKLDDLIDKVSSILVVGGGFLGSELAVGLASRGLKKSVNIIQLFPEVGNLGLILPADLSKWTTDKVKKVGVQVLPGTTVKEVQCADGKVKVTTSKDEKLEVDHVVVAVGLLPNTNLASSAGLETDPLLGGYRVNAELQACTDVWVAGDVSCFYDPHLGRRRVEHHDHANVSGRLAGRNMTGAHERFTHQSMFWSDVGPDVGFEATGLIDARLPTVGVWGRQSANPLDNPEDDYSKGVVFYLSPDIENNIAAGKKIVGVLTWNLFGKMDLAKQVIAEGKREADIGEFASKFDIH